MIKLMLQYSIPMCECFISDIEIIIFIWEDREDSDSTEQTL